MSFKIIHGDALDVLPTLQKEYYDAVITDPPYSSGGQFFRSRSVAPNIKYFNKPEYSSFAGDNLDQRSWTNWCRTWLAETRKVCKGGATCAVFTDWRQLPALTDALQWAGWTWRGIMVWDKLNSRPLPGRPRNQAEYIVWGSNGALSTKRDAPVIPGVFPISSIFSSKKIHITEKPLTLMQEIVKICVDKGHILDPFAGSGSTLIASYLEGFDSTGIEIMETNVEIITKRFEETRNIKQIN